MSIHFIKKSEDEYVMFISNALKFYNVNENVKNAVADMQGNTPKTEILSKYNISNEAFEKLRKTINSDNVEDITGESPDTLYRLVLNVTNSCNLNCRYCYADGGSYSSSECLMDITTAKRALDVFYSKYKTIKVIQFFGGEPLLNEPTIRFVCEYINELYANGKIDTLPVFGTITNGTIYSEKLAETISKYNISLTFSIDGPKDIHNSMRVYNNGTGSFEKILENIEKYNAHSIRPTASEVTFNVNHLNNGYSVTDTVKYIKDELQIPNVHIVPVSGDDAADYKLGNRDDFTASVEEIFNEMNMNKKDYSYSFVNRIIKSLKIKKSNKYLCEAGISNYSVSCKGDVYPCFMFTDIPQYRMGNVFDETLVFDNAEFIKLKDTFSKFSKYEYEKCKNCFNNRICSGCLGTNYFNSNDVFCTPDEDCEMQKALTEKVLIELSKLV